MNFMTLSIFITLIKLSSLPFLSYVTHVIPINLLPCVVLSRLGHVNMKLELVYDVPRVCTFSVLQRDEK